MFERGKRKKNKKFLVGSRADSMRHSLEPRSSINYTTHEYSRSANFRPESKSAIYSSAPQPDLGGAGPLLPPLPDQRSSQPSPPVPGAVKVGERLASKYDLSMVHPDDLPRVLDAITKVLSCETPMPEVKLTIQVRTSREPVKKN